MDGMLDKNYFHWIFSFIKHTNSFQIPSPETINIVPGFYMLFFVDCMGKPSKSIMTRFDNDAMSVL